MQLKLLVDNVASWAQETMARQLLEGFIKATGPITAERWCPVYGKVYARFDYTNGSARHQRSNYKV